MGEKPLDKSYLITVYRYLADYFSTAVFCYNLVTIACYNLCHNKNTEGFPFGNGDIKMSERILVIEDEEAINDLICINLEVAGYEAVPFYDGTQAQEALEKEQGCGCGCAVVDVMLPEKDGFELLPKLRSCGIPVIFLTAKSDVHSKVRGLTEGAEDYMVKPFEMLELLVRIDKILQRRRPVHERIRIHDVEIFPEERKVQKAGEDVYLKPMEFDCLMMFVKNKNKALTRSQLLHALWGVSFDGETRTVDAHVGRIRKKLGFQDVIQTIPRIGYRLTLDEDCSEYERKDC